MIISIPCSKKIFNVWYSIIIIAAFCCKFPGPLFGLLGLVFFILIKILENIRFREKTNLLLKDGLLPVETVGAISLALNEKIKQMDRKTFTSFKSQYDFFKIALNDYYPNILDNDDMCSIEEIKPVLKYIESQIAFIKKHMTELNKDILNEQLNAYFILLVFCYSKFYKDVKIITKELFDKLS